MRLIEPEEMRRYTEVLHAHSWDAAEFELDEVEVTDPGSDELLSIKGLYRDPLQLAGPLQGKSHRRQDRVGPASGATCSPGGSYDSAQRAPPRCRQGFGRHSGRHHG